nr:uncharacterized protein LOC108391369 [Manis javanica]
MENVLRERLPVPCPSAVLPLKLESSFLTVSECSCDPRDSSRQETRAPLADVARGTAPPARDASTIPSYEGSPASSLKSRLSLRRLRPPGCLCCRVTTPPRPLLRGEGASGVVTRDTWMPRLRREDRCSHCRVMTCTESPGQRGCRLITPRTLRAGEDTSCVTDIPARARGGVRPGASPGHSGSPRPTPRPGPPSDRTRSPQACTLGPGTCRGWRGGGRTAGRRL